MKRDLRSRPVMAPANKDELVEILSSPVMGRLLWAPDGNLYVENVGYWFKLEVEVLP